MGVNLEYDSENYLTGIERYEDLTATALIASSAYVYDEKNRLTSLSHDQGATSLASYSWVYDSANRITQFTTVDGVANYDYDARGQLTEADYDFQSDESYQYDENGNRTDKNGTTVTTGDHNRLANDGTYTYEYDAHGNRTKRTKISDQFWTEYKWDTLNRLIGVTDYNESGTEIHDLKYTYDVYNRLIVREEDATGDGSFEKAESYVYDGHDLNHIVLRFEDADGEGTQESPELASRYLWNHVRDEIWAEEKIDELLGPTTIGKTYWTLNDHLGSVRDIAKHDDTTGITEVVVHRVYDAYGQITAETNPADPGGEIIVHINGFTGRYVDSFTKLQRHGERYYDPATGTWANPDPIVFEGGDGNLYRYVFNMPTVATDPTGESTLGGYGDEFADAVANADDSIADAIADIVDEMEAENWNRTDAGYRDTDAGAFGKEVHARLARQIREPGWFSPFEPDRSGHWRSNVYIHVNSGRVAGGPGDGIMEVDAAYFLGDYNPQSGHVIDPERVVPYEVKTSAGGTIRARQKANYHRIFGSDRTRLLTTRLRLNGATGGLQANSKFIQRIRLLGIFGIGISSTYAMITFDADGPQYEQLVAAVDDLQNASDSERPFAEANVIRAYQRYMSDATGGYVDQVGNIALVAYLYDEVIPDFAAGRDVTDGAFDEPTGPTPGFEGWTYWDDFWWAFGRWDRGTFGGP